MDGLRQGEGRLRYANGDVYVGTFVGTQRQGVGVYYYVNKASAALPAAHWLSKLFRPTR